MPETIGYCPKDTQRMTKIQTLREKGGLELDASPLDSWPVIQKYRPLFDEAFGLGKKEKGSIEEAHAKALVADNLRQMLLNPYVRSSSDEITRDIPGRMRLAISQRGKQKSKIRYFSRGEAFAGLDRQFKEDARECLARNADSYFSGIAKKTVNNYSDAPSRPFELLTVEVRNAAEHYLNLAYPNWRTLDADVRAYPGKYEKDYPPDLVHWLGRLHVSDNITQSFSGALTGPALFIPDRLSDLHTACYDAGCPPKEWWPLSYRKLKLLAIESQVVSTQDGAVLKDPTRPNPYRVFQTPNGSWDAYFSHELPYFAYLVRTYENENDPFHKCQAARMFNVINNFSGEGIPNLFSVLAQGKADVDFTQAESIAHLTTLMTVTLGENSGLLLHRQAPPPEISKYSYIFPLFTSTHAK